MQKSILLIRHPDTGIDSNNQKPSDKPAAYESERLEKLAKKLQNKDIDSMISSDFERAREAAEIVLSSMEYPKALIVDALLREVLIWPDVKNLGSRDSIEEKERVLGVYLKLQEEVMGKLHTLASRYEGNVLCFFTHGNFIRCVATTLGKHALEEMYHVSVDHLSITSLQFDTESSRFTLEKVNDTLI